MRVDTATGLAPVKRRQEERRALRGFQEVRHAQVSPCLQLHDEHVCWHEVFFLDARGGEVDVWTVPDGDAAAGAGYLFVER